MIDIENKVLDTVFAAVRLSYPTAQCYGEYVPCPAAFPAVCLYEANNTTYKRSQDDVLNEHQANLMYECNVYSDKANGHKAEARDIAKKIDASMQGMMFTRTFMQPIPNIDRTIYRITMRWEAIAGEPITTSGNDTIYQMYRK